jgi:hypothetical protein
MSTKTFTMIGRQSRTRRFGLVCVILAALTLGGRPAHAQGRDALLNGAVIGGAVGAGMGVAFTHAVRDSDLVFEPVRARGSRLRRHRRRGGPRYRCVVESCGACSRCNAAASVYLTRPLARPRGRRGEMEMVTCPGGRPRRFVRCCRRTQPRSASGVVVPGTNAGARVVHARHRS